MPPQFFKDVSHPGLNGKFMSRTISLKMDHNANQDSSVDSIGDDQSLVSSNVSQNTSATSTGSFSKFFGTNNNTGAKSTQLLKDYILNDSSLDDIVIPDNVLRSKSSQREIQRDDDDDDDDIQITDVREIVLTTPMPTPSKDNTEVLRNSTTPIIDYEGDNSSADVMLEALYKSQKYSTFLKKNLEVVNAKVSNQEIEIANYQKKNEQLKETFNKFKEGLSILEKESEELKNSRKIDNEKLISMKNEHKTITELLSSYKIEIGNLKKQLDQLKKIKVSTTYEIEKRNKDISILEKRLDEKSGLLSEQKIRTLDLEKLLEGCRKEYDQNINNIMDSSKEFQESLVKKLEDSFDQLEVTVKSIFNDSLSKLINKTGTNIDDKIEDLGKKFTKSLDLSSNSISTKIDESNGEQIKSLVRTISDQSEENAKTFNTLTENQKKQQKDFIKITDLIDKINSSITDKNFLTENFNDFFSIIEVRIEDLDKAIKNQNGLTLKVNSLSKEKEELELSRLIELKKIEELEKIITDNSTTILNHDKNVQDLEFKCKEYINEITQLKTKMTSIESNLKTSEDKMLKCKSNCDSKLKTQLDIHGIVIQERDEFKQELENQKNDLNDLIEIQTNQIENLKRENSKLLRDFEKKSKAEHKTIMDLKKENADLNQEIKELKTKSTINLRKHVFSEDLEKNNSMIDVPITFKKNLSTDSNKKDSIIVKKKPKVPTIGKRKKLLDEDEVSIFDDFDFDSVIESQVPSLPRRYTKKKRS